jgi:hypothetical protein
MNLLDGINQQWIVDHAGMIILTTAVVIEWIAIQAILIHYHFFRESLKRPTPDGIRFSTIEKVMSLHASQMDRAFGKMSELSKEISSLAERRPERMIAAPSTAASEPTVLSLGEMNLKKRLAELRAAMAKVN